MFLRVPAVPNLSSASAMAWFFTMSMRPRPRQKWGKMRRTFFRTSLMPPISCKRAWPSSQGTHSGRGPSPWQLTLFPNSSMTKVEMLPLMPMRMLTLVRTTYAVLGMVKRKEAGYMRGVMDHLGAETG